MSPNTAIICPECEASKEVEVLSKGATLPLYILRCDACGYAGHLREFVVVESLSTAVDG